MADVEITIDDEAAMALLEAMPGRLDLALRAGLTDASSYLLRQVRVYPPQRQGSSYVRRGNLRRSWSRRLESTSDELTAIVGSDSNIAPYNREVQDAERQAAVHQGRWRTIQDISRDSEAQIREMVQDRIRALLD